MTYRDALTRLAAATEAQVVAAYTAWTENKIDDGTLVAVIAAYVAAANSRAVALADLSLATAVTVALRRPVAPLGLLPPVGDTDRLHTAATTLLAALAATPDPVARVARLGRAEPLTTAARTYSEAIKRSPHVTGWTRGLSATACQLCRWWHRDGQVWPADHPMPTHKGCSCIPIPAVRR